MKRLRFASFLISGMLGLTGAVQGQSKDLEWHSTDPAGIPYERSVLIDPTCHVIEPPGGCSFEHTQTSLPGDNTPYDTWHVSYQAPGRVYSVHCEVFAHEHLLNETYVNNTAKCDGQINGGAARVRMTLRWKQQW